MSDSDFCLTQKKTNGSSGKVHQKTLSDKNVAMELKAKPRGEPRARAVILTAPHANF